MAMKFPEASGEIKAILSNPSIQKMMDSVEQLLLDEKDLTPQQWKYYQQRINSTIDDLTKQFKTTAKDLTEINSLDSVEVKLIKFRLQKCLIDFLQNTFDKLKEYVNNIFDQIKKGIKWCWGKLKEAFASFKRLFN